eukprot:GEMP01014581.1.p1 GENE.GEMP01014581.1~~GEMP01014581.1.p1  ORF type:complete len:467 (+),score=71.61 GEMP01014581.1:91-1401(+)
MGLYKHAECAAGGEEIVLLIFGRGKKPRKGKKSNASAGATGKHGDNSYVENVRDNGDGTWTAVVRNAQKTIASKWENMCGTQQDEGANAGYLSTSDSRKGSRTNDKQKRSQEDDFVVTQQNASARKEEGVPGLDCYRVEQDRENEEIWSQSNTIPGAHPGSVGDFGSPKGREAENKRVDDDEMQVLLANLGDLPVDQIDKIVVTQPQENTKDHREMEHFYRQGSDFHLPRSTGEKDDAYWRKMLDKMAQVRELDTFAYGKFDALVLDNDIEDSVFASQQFLYVKPEDNRRDSLLLATPLAHALDAIPMNCQTTSRQGPSKFPYSDGGSPVAAHNVISMFGEQNVVVDKQESFDRLSKKSLDFFVTSNSGPSDKKKSPVHKASSDKSLNIMLGSNATIGDRKTTKQSIEVVDETGSAMRRVMKIINTSEYSAPQEAY